MKKIKKIGSSLLVALFGLSCTTIIKTMEEKKKTSYLLAVLGPDSQYVKNIINVWKISEDGQKVSLLFPIVPPENSFISTLTFSPNGKYLIGRSKQRIYAWDISNQEMGGQMEVGGNGSLSMVLSPDGQSFALADSNGTIENITIGKFEGAGPVVNFEVLKKFQVNKGYTVKHLAFSFDGEYLGAVITSENGPPIFKKLFVKGEKSFEVSSTTLSLPRNHRILALSSDGEYLALARDKQIIIWDTLNNKEWYTFDNKRLESYTKAIFSHNTKYFIVKYPSNVLRFTSFDIFGIDKKGKFKFLKTIQKKIAYNDPTATMAFSFDGELFAVADNHTHKSVVMIWATANFKKPHAKISRGGMFGGKRVEALAFQPEPEPGKPFHLEETTLQQEKIEFLGELLGKIEKEEKKQAAEERAEEEGLPEGSKNLPAFIFLLSVSNEPEQIERMHERGKRYIEKQQKKFPDFSDQLEQQRIKLEKEYKKALERIKQKIK